VCACINLVSLLPVSDIDIEGTLKRDRLANGMGTISSQQQRADDALRSNVRRMPYR